MQQDDFDQIFGQVQQVTRVFVGLYRETTGEDLDLDGIVRHYPLLAVGVVAGAAAVGGFLAGRRSVKQLPPPRQELPNPFEYVERLLPDGIEKVRELLPEAIADEAAATARTWVDEVLEPRLKEGVDAVVANVAETRFGSFLKQTIERLEHGEDTQLEDPE